MGRITIKDIAKKLQISPATVSLALNSSSLVNNETMQRVKRAAEEMGYRPNAAARSLVLKKSHILGIVIPDITNAFFSAIVSGAEKVANAQGYNLLICDTNWSSELESQHLNLIIEKGIDGILIAYWNKENLALDHLLERNYPLVFISSAHPNQDAHFVGADTEQGGYLAAKHLIELGHRDIAFIGGKFNSESIQRRYSGFLKAFEEYQLSFQTDLVYEGDFSVESGYKNGLRLLQEVPHVTGILTADDLIAIGVLKAAAELGRKIPEELSLVGFDDIAAASFPGINLTTVFQESYLMGHLAVEILLEQLTSKKSVVKKKRVILPTQLKVRKTTGPYHKRS